MLPRKEPPPLLLKGLCAAQVLASTQPVLCWPLCHADATYSGGATWSGTGVQFSSDASVVKGAIALLKQKNPRTKVRREAVF